MLPNQRLGPVLALLANALFWGLTWWPFRQLQQAGLHPLWSTAGIYVMALLVLIVWRPYVWKDWGRFPSLWILAITAGLTNVGFNWAVAQGDVVRVVLLFYFMPAWSVGVAWLMLGERPNFLSMLRVGLALLGVMIVLAPDDNFWPWPQSLTDFLALMGGLAFAFTNVMLLKLRHVPGVLRMGTMFVGGAGMALGAAWLSGESLFFGLSWHWSWGTWVIPGTLILTLSVGLFAITMVTANGLLQYGAARLPSQATALLLLTEVLVATVSSVWAGAGQLEPRAWVGGGLILAAALLAVKSSRLD